MQVIAVSTVRNETDIIESFIRHTAAFVDTHLIIDHASTDDTPAILDAIAGDGVAVVVERDDRPGFFQAERMTRLMHRAVTEFGADWVVPLDADEFIVARSPRAFRRVLRRHTEPVFLRWRTYVPDPGDDPTELVAVRRLRRRLAEEAEVIVKVVVPGSVAAEARFVQGSHDIEGGGRRWPILKGAALAHFPVRSVEQFAMKAAIATFEYLTRGERHGWGHHYIEPYETLLRGWSEFEAEYFEAVRRYGLRPGERFDGEVIDDPLRYRGGTPRHTPLPRSSEPLRSILEYTADLARRYGEAVGEAGFRSELTDPGGGGAEPLA